MSLIKKSLIKKYYKIADQKFPIFMLIDSDTTNLWIKLNHIARILGYSNVEKSYHHISEKNKCYATNLNIIVPQNKKKPGSLMVNEYGLYELLLKSKKPNHFIKWVFKKMLPSVYKKYHYVNSEFLQFLRKPVVDDDNLGFIFLATSEKYIERNWFKIEHTKNINTEMNIPRLREMNIPRATDLLYYYFVCPLQNADILEKQLHIIFKKKRVHGKFYTLSTNDIERIVNLCNKKIKYY